MYRMADSTIAPAQPLLELRLPKLSYKKQSHPFPLKKMTGNG